MSNKSKIERIIKAIKFLAKDGCFNCDRERSNDYYIYSKLYAEIHQDVFEFLKEEFQLKTIKFFYDKDYLEEPLNHLMKTNIENYIYVEIGTIVKIHSDLENILFYGLFQQMMYEIICRFNLGEKSVFEYLNDSIFFKESIMNNGKFSNYKSFILYFNGENYQRELFEKHWIPSKKIKVMLI